jgi:tetratricopeptide (TPR) repeat protein
VLLQKQGRMQAAADEYAAVLRADPDHVDAHNNLGVALPRLGRRDEALGHFRRAVQIDPDHQNASRNLRAALAP